MLKFLRKYNTIILVIGGVFLMIAFLVPQALTQVGQGGGGRTMFVLDDQEVTAAEASEYFREWSIIRSLAPQFAQAMMIESPEHWLLLSWEAKRAGLVGGKRDGQAVVDVLAEYRLSVDPLFNFQARSLTGAELEALREQYLTEYRGQFAQARAAAEQRNTPDQIDESLATLHGVLRMLLAYRGVSTLSKPEARLIGQELFDRVVTDTWIFEAEEIRDDPQTLAPARLEAFFNEYKDIRASDSELGVGYLRPRAARVEAVKISRGALADAIEIDAVDANVYWRQNRETYGADYASVRGRVEADLRDSRVREVLGEVEQRVRRELQRTRLGLSEDGRYVRLPADWATRRLTMQQLEEKIEDELRQRGVLDPSSIVTVVADDGRYYTQEELGTIADLGLSRFAANARQTLPFAQVVMNAREFGGDSRLPIQEGIVFGPLTRDAITDGQVFYARITEARPESPPDSWREVEQQVREDLADAEAMERLRGGMDRLRQAAETGDVNAVAALGFGPPGVQPNVEVTRTVVESVSVVDGARRRFEMINSPTVRDAILDRVRAWDPRQEVSELALADRVVVVADERLGLVVIATITGRVPMTLEQYRRGTMAIETRNQRRTQEAMSASPFSFSTMSERLGFRALEGDEQ